MDFRHIVYFVEVARQLSFTKASNNLYVSQPALSKMIKTLENELGVSLFYRTSKQIELTDAGKELLPKALNILTCIDQFTEALDPIKHLKKGTIRIGIPPIIGASFFPKIIGGFKGKYPGIQISLLEVGTKQIEVGVLDGTLDVGVVCSTPKNIQEFDQFLLISDPLMLVIHKDKPLAQKEYVSFADLINENFILYRQDFSLHDRILNQCSKYGFIPNIVCESSQRDFMIEMVGSELGVALLPSRVCDEISNRPITSIKLKDNELFLELSIIWKKDKYLPFAAQEWLHYAMSNLDKIV